MQGRRVELPLAVPAAAPVRSSQQDWWLATGDPVLAQLVAQGLSGSLACEAAGLAARHRHGIFGAHDAWPAGAGYAYADHRARAAAAIAHAYVDVRKWQALLALRMGVVHQYRDNAEIAHFRYEAGLVPALDGEMTGALAAQNDAAKDRTRSRLDAGIVALSTLTGTPADELKAQLGPAAPIPDLGSLPSDPGAAAPDLSARADLLALKVRLEQRLRRANIAQAGLDQALADPAAGHRASLVQDSVAAWRSAQASAAMEIRSLSALVATADLQLQGMPQHEASARRSVADARLAYRAGAGDFATLFVTEVAALGVEEALVEARADRAGAMIDLRTARGEGWSQADLAPAAITAAAARKGADCE